MVNRVIVCKGCCCGNVDRGHDEVPVEMLEKAWAERNLGTRDPTYDFRVSGDV